jgi:hypothetical protein
VPQRRLAVPFSEVLLATTQPPIDLVPAHLCSFLLLSFSGGIPHQLFMLQMLLLHTTSASSVLDVLIIVLDTSLWVIEVLLLRNIVLSAPLENYAFVHLSVSLRLILLLHVHVFGW